MFKHPVFLIIVVCQLAHVSSPYASSIRNSTIDVNLNDKYSYRLLTRQLTIKPTKNLSDNIKPVSYREMYQLRQQNKKLESQIRRASTSGLLHNNQNTIMSASRYVFRPITEINIVNINSSDANPKIPSNNGENVAGRNTNVLSANGAIFFKDYFVASHETRIKYDQEENQTSLHKFQLKKAFAHTSLSFSRDNIVLGPGYFGNIILSDNVEPEQIAMFKTELPYNVPFLGSMRWYLWHIWYEENQRENLRPKLLGLHISFKPSKYIEFGISRTSYYSGKSNNDISSVRELWKLTTAEDENVPSSLNTDQLAGIDISLYLPQVRRYSVFKGVKLYTERVWNDIKAFWQEEDRNDSQKLQLLGTSFLYGVFATTGKLDLHFEFVKTTKLIYAHHDFGTSGSSVNGYIIGHHIGRDAHAYLSSVYFEWKPKLHFSTSYAWIERGLSLRYSQEVNELSGAIHYFTKQNIQFAFYTTYIQRNRTDIDQSPVNYRFIDQKDNEVRVRMGMNYQFR